MSSMKSWTLARWTMTSLAICAVLFVLGWVLENHNSGFLGVLGGIGWFGFMLTGLITIVLGLMTLVARMRRSPAASS
jgi:hypothetical protein